MNEETIGQLYDSLAPHGQTTRRYAGQTWLFTRMPELAPMDVCEVCGDTTETAPLCKACDEGQRDG